jgi:hypothetical protein
MRPRIVESAAFVAAGLRGCGIACLGATIGDRSALIGLAVGSSLIAAIAFYTFGCHLPQAAITRGVGPGP